MAKTEYTLDDLSDVSLALRELLAQRSAAAGQMSPDQAAIDLLTGDESGPACYDLTASCRAAIADDRSPDTLGRRRYMSPRRYVNGWPHMVNAIDEPGDGRILVDESAAFDYCMRADSRVMGAAIDHTIETRKAAAAVDPIGNAVAAAKGGGFAMMFARMDSLHLGLGDDEFYVAVLERAKLEAASMDESAAEEHVATVRKAIESAPGVRQVSGDDQHP